MHPLYFFPLLFSAFYLLRTLSRLLRSEARQCIPSTFAPFSSQHFTFSRLSLGLEVRGRTIQPLYCFILLFSTFYLLLTLTRPLKSEARPCSLSTASSFSSQFFYLIHYLRPEARQCRLSLLHPSLLSFFTLCTI
jgi:hypothetical protein